MLPEWQAHIDELLERYRQKRGRLVGLEFNPRVYRRMSPSELAAAVLAAAGEASSQVDGQVRAALAPLRPPAPETGNGGAAGTGGTDGCVGAGGQPGQSAQTTPTPQTTPPG